ncbi:MAG: hypothetical protein H0U35_13300 [Sporichthyaceae bacterium]|nr:hypothetical protein [Sporichthyaceae bacterium]
MRLDFTTMHATLIRRRQERQERHRLERELASFDTPAGRSELEAILERHSTSEIAPIQPILDRVLFHSPIHVH